MPKFNKKRLRSWVAAEIAIARSRKQRGKFRIIIYARYSTEDQNPKSIEAQIDEVKRFLTDHGVNLRKVDVRILSDEGISGTHFSRPGIDRVKEEIDARGCDLLITEEASRFYRNFGFCIQLVDMAVDNNIRVICVSDRVDTADDEDVWDDRLRRVCEHHSESCRYLRRRIKRSLTRLHKDGAAVGPLRPGYKRKATHQATQREPEKGPYFDEIDRKWSPVVYEAFVRVANGEALPDIADWLTTTELPKTPGVRTDKERKSGTKKEWTDRNVISLIRETIYRGLSQYRVTVVRQERQTGLSRQVPNEPEEISEEELPHLRIVPDWLFRDANKAIDQRRTRDEFSSGIDHPLYGIPRDSRGPLSRIATCGICGGRINLDGRLEGGYRCSRTRGKDPGCWNRATALRQLTRERIGEVIACALNDSIPLILDIADRLRNHFEDGTALQGTLDALVQQLEPAETRCESLAKKIAECDTELDSLFSLLREYEAERDDLRCDIEQLRESSSQHVVPTRHALHEDLSQRRALIREMTRESRRHIEPLVESLRFVPYQQFGSDKVVLRAEVDLNLWHALPYVMRAKAQAVLADGVENFDLTSLRVSCVIDLFQPSTVPGFAMQVLELRKRNRVKAVAAELNISEMSVKRCLQYARQLQAAGLTDPFVRLETEPDSASRWRIRRSA
jgi:DNA invertase Pin-like site-specific DNA recombinase